MEPQGKTTLEYQALRLAPVAIALGAPTLAWLHPFPLSQCVLFGGVAGAAIVLQTLAARGSHHPGTQALNKAYWLDMTGELEASREALEGVALPAERGAQALALWINTRATYALEGPQQALELIESTQLTERVGLQQYCFGDSPAYWKGMASFFREQLGQPPALEAVRYSTDVTAYSMGALVLRASADTTLPSAQEVMRNVAPVAYEFASPNLREVMRVREMEARASEPSPYRAGPDGPGEDIADSVFQDRREDRPAVVGVPKSTPTVPSNPSTDPFRRTLFIWAVLIGLSLLVFRVMRPSARGAERRPERAVREVALCQPASAGVTALAMTALAAACWLVLLRHFRKNGALRKALQAHSHRALIAVYRGDHEGVTRELSAPTPSPWPQRQQQEALWRVVNDN